MSNDIYRPLVVMVEAVEAEAKRKLEEQRKQGLESVTTPMAPARRGFSWVDAASILQRELRRRYQDDTLSIETRVDVAGWRLRHRCKVCTKVHSLDVDELLMVARMGNGLAGLVDVVLAKIDELYALPCALELAKP